MCSKWSAELPVYLPSSVHRVRHPCRTYSRMREQINTSMLSLFHCNLDTAYYVSLEQPELDVLGRLYVNRYLHPSVVISHSLCTYYISQLAFAIHNVVNFCETSSRFRLLRHLCVRASSPGTGAGLPQRMLVIAVLSPMLTRF